MRQRKSKATSTQKTSTIRLIRPSKADFLRGWKLPYPAFQYSSLRYKHPPEKGVYWYYFSLFIRKRDVDLWGTCISCNREITVETSNAGHFMPAYDCGRDLLFDPRNVNAECEHCNAWDETHLLGYADNLDKRYGVGTALNLRERKNLYKNSKTRVKDFSGADYALKVYSLSSFQLVDK